MAEFSRRSSGEEAEEQACSNNFVMNEDVLRYHWRGLIDGGRGPQVEHGGELVVLRPVPIDDYRQAVSISGFSRCSHSSRLTPSTGSSASWSLAAS